MQNNRTNNLKLAERGVWISISAYILLSVLQIAVAQLTNSDSLRANGFNNFTDIIGNIAILIGLRIARIPRDNDHTYGHWKVESIASLISSFIMVIVGFTVLRDTSMTIISGNITPVDPIGALAGIFSALVMFFVYLYSKNLAKKTQSQALKASSLDNLTDAITSLSTAVAIVASSIHWYMLDKIMAIVIALVIFKTAYEIFRDSVFTLSDGFDEKLLQNYTDAVKLVDKVKNVKMIRGRNYGNNIFLDVVVEMSPDLSVYESHEITEQIEKMLMEGFDVFDVDVHVEPAELPENEHYSSRALELLALEEHVLNHEDLSDLTRNDFIEINANGQILHLTEKLAEAAENPLAISNYEASQVSKKTFIINYHYLDDGKSYLVTSIWRRNELWQCIHRQITEIKTHE